MENVKILICDDSVLARKQLKDIIKKCGYDNFIEASNGQEAFDRYKEEQPDLAFAVLIPKPILWLFPLWVLRPS